MWQFSFDIGSFGEGEGSKGRLDDNCVSQTSEFLPYGVVGTLFGDSDSHFLQFTALLPSKTFLVNNTPTSGCLESGLLTTCKQ